MLRHATVSASDETRERMIAYLDEMITRLAICLAVERDRGAAASNAQSSGLRGGDPSIRDAFSLAGMAALGRKSPCTLGERRSRRCTPVGHE